MEDRPDKIGTAILLLLLDFDPANLGAVKGDDVANASANVIVPLFVSAHRQTFVVEAGTAAEFFQQKVPVTDPPIASMVPRINKSLTVFLFFLRFRRPWNRAHRS